MARRLFNGRRFSENGWPYVDEGSCTWVTVPGTDVTLQIQNGPPLAVMRAFAADYHAYIEPLRDPDSACWTPGNSVATSNHPGGTAMDLNWNGHAFQVRYTFTSAQQDTIRELLKWYEGTIYWGGDWNSPVDEMHWQMGYDTYDQNADAPFPKVLDFIQRKIRPDGFSTFRRGAAPASPPAVDVLARATGLTYERSAQILPAVTSGLQQSKCANVNRIAMWLAQIGHESAGFNATEEYQSGDESTDRWKYKGRTWIQITWASNYAGFSRWCFDQGLVSSPTYFVDRPKELADLKWAGLGPAWYWTQARPDINALSDARNLVTVTQRINGGQNGIDDRRARYNRALALGDQLLALITPTTPADSFEELLMLSAPSLSIYADPGEPDVPIVDMIRALDAHGPHEPYVEKQARSGDRDALRRVVRTAAGKGPYGTAAFAVNQSASVLAEIEATNPDILKNYLKGNQS